MVRLISAAAGLALAGAALAGIEPLPTTFHWVQVDNTVGDPGADALNGALWMSNNWVTYDLYLEGNYGVNGVNLGSAPGEDHLGLNFFGADIFNTQGFVASDIENGAQAAFAASLYDTYVTLGNNNPGGNAGNQMITIATNGLVGDGLLRGAWAHNPVNGGSNQDASTPGGIRLLRVSFDADDLNDVLGGGQMQIGVNAGVFTVTVPPIVPTPGAAALLGLGGLVSLRRRR